jgi:hypothetical protein
MSVLKTRGKIILGTIDGWNVTEYYNQFFDEMWYYVNWRGERYYHEQRTDRVKAKRDMNNLKRVHGNNYPD